MKFLEKIRNLPEKKRKTILLFLMVIAGIFLLFLYIKNLQYNFTKKLDFSSFKEGFKNILQIKLSK